MILFEEITVTLLVIEYIAALTLGILIARGIEELIRYIIRERLM